MKNIALIIGSMMAGGIIAVGGYMYFASAHPSANTPPAAEKEARNVLFWYDPMYPNTRFDKPGKSPFMDMDLVPKYADEESASAAAPGVRIDRSPRYRPVQSWQRFYCPRAQFRQASLRFILQPARSGRQAIFFPGGVRILRVTFLQGDNLNVEAHIDKCGNLIENEGFRRQRKFQ